MIVLDNLNDDGELLLAQRRKNYNSRFPAKYRVTRRSDFRGYILLSFWISSNVSRCCRKRFKLLLSFKLTISPVIKEYIARAAGRDWCFSLNGNVCFRHVFDGRNEIEFHKYNGLIDGKSLIGSVESTCGYLNVMCYT